jgi:serine/threonine protein kinase
MSDPLDDRNLLFGVLALHADLIDSEQFVDVCSAWAGRKSFPLAELLVTRGWITPEDRTAVEHLVALKLRKHGGDASASLAAVVDDQARCALTRVGDSEIQRSLDEIPRADATPPASTTLTYQPEARGRYSLRFLHARGGIGQVWRAHDADLDREVALKELQPQHVRNATALDRFLNEARITGQLEHPGVVPVYELIRQAPNHASFYTMRFIKGKTLTDSVRSYHLKRVEGQADPLDLLSLLNAFVTVCNTIAFAHSRGIVHRDLKGQNIILGDFGDVVVLDWGLAKVLGRSEGGTGMLLEHQGAIVDEERTVHGEVIGTPCYMAPEQAAGRPDLIDHRTDVYGLGAILYEILTGRPPFEGRDPLDVLRKVREEEPALPRRLNGEAPPALESASLRALAKDPSQRPSSASELAAEVQYWQDLQRRRAEEALKRANEDLTCSNAQLRQLTTDLEAKIASEQRAHQELMEAQKAQIAQAEVLARLGRMSATIADEIDGINASLTKSFFSINERSKSLCELLQKYQDAERSLAERYPEAHRHFQVSVGPTGRRSERADLEDLLAMSRSGLLRIRQIVRNFHDIARRAEGDSLSPDLNIAIEPAVEIFRSRAEGRGVRFEVDFAPSLAPVTCTPTEVNQIIYHLLGNAIDACSEGDTVTLRTCPAEGAVEVHVTDTGCGIASDHLDKIFEMFFTTKPPGLGNGLGLSLSRLIAEDNGGKIWVDSALGGPTHFTLWLPVKSGWDARRPE